MGAPMCDGHWPRHHRPTRCQHTGYDTVNGHKSLLYECPVRWCGFKVLREYTGGRLRKRHRRRWWR